MFTVGFIVWAIAVATPGQAQTVAVPSPAEAAREYVLSQGSGTMPQGHTRTGRRRRASRAHVSHDALQEVGQTLSAIFYRFFGNITPGPGGVERPNPEERLLDEFEIRLGDTNISYVIQGVGNYRILSRSYFYQQFDGVQALRVNLVPVDDASPFRISLTLSPLYGSISLVKNHMGVDNGEPLPGEALMGGAVGGDASYHAGPLNVGVRAYMFPETDVTGSGASGVSQFESIRFGFNISEAVHWRTEVPVEASVLLLHRDRGTARLSMFEPNAMARSLGNIQEVWEGFVALTFRYQ